MYINLKYLTKLIFFVMLRIKSVHLNEQNEITVAIVLNLLDYENIYAQHNWINTPTFLIYQVVSDNETICNLPIIIIFEGGLIRGLRNEDTDRITRVADPVENHW